VSSPARVRPPGEAGWFGQGGGAATMAAKEQRDLADLWVPVIRSKSCGLRILMDQPTESISSHDPPSRHGDS
jgi:hypothetical protein